MSYILQNWNILITSTLHPTNLDLFSYTDESIQNRIAQSKDEQDKVRTLFLEGILERPKVKDRQQYVKLNQVILIRLLDQLFSYMQSENLNDKIIYLYDIISSHLENSLNFIEDFFGNYCNRDEKVPIPHFINSAKELSRQVELLEKAIPSPEVNVSALVNILVNNFNKFCSQQKSSPTYNELMYQGDLMNQLQKDESLASENSIKKILFYFNYNDDDFIVYLQGKLNRLTESLNTKKEKIAGLLFEQKVFNQLPTRLNCYLSNVMPSLKEQLNHWIEEEVKFLERGHIAKAQDDIAIRANKNEEVYVHVPFKGAEIYLLHKAFVDSGGASGETYKSLFEKTGAHLTNKNQKGFSTESLQKNSDKVNYEVKDNVKRFLQKMIRNIDSY
jgi:hypothetical protein